MSVMTTTVLLGILGFVLLALVLFFTIKAFRRMNKNPYPYQRGHPDPMEKES